jgi:hypothetical protein
MTQTQIKALLAIALGIALALAVFLARGVFLGAGTSEAIVVSQRVLLADNSLDATAGQRAEALRVLERMVDRAADEQGVIAAAPFQGNALGTIDWPINHRFVPDASAPNSYYRRLSLAAQAERVKAQARTLLAARSDVQGTDIVGALLAASEFFASQPDGPRTLVLVSNMFAVSADDDVRLKRKRLTAAQIAAAVDRLEQQGKVPRLDRVCVLVVGAGILAGAEVATSVQLGLRDFWGAYFARTGARVRAWVPTLGSDGSC